MILLCLLAFWTGTWLINAELSQHRGPLVRYVVPLIFGLSVLGIWEMGVRAYGVSPAILPPPSKILRRQSPRVRCFGLILCRHSFVERCLVLSLGVRRW